ncbi:hypothetical protein N7478_011875 [Penicillium angulare]|uniref:uncharacterized protein n=1 Tax=Penicillium angulare TaxID=116970 RepID=UPI00253FA9CC|nr:uncharacterized protein N7478_011875 [Penicillium angulare]KAJ5261280.1 hypothetical protein N7478_011875 [Penicillium angulare]
MALNNISMDRGIDHSLTDYEEARAALQQQEREISFDFAFKRDQSNLEIQASEVLDRIRIAEHERLKSTTGLERGQRFYEMLSAIEDSDLLRTAKRSPKGALLHCHFDAMLPPEVMLPMAQKMSNMHIKCTEPLVEAGSFSKALPEMQLLSKKKAMAMSHINIFDRSYSSNDWMLYSDFRRSFPTGDQGADEWLLSKIELQRSDAHSPQRTVNRCMP